MLGLFAGSPAQQKLWVQLDHNAYGFSDKWDIHNGMHIKKKHQDHKNLDVSGTCIVRQIGGVILSIVILSWYMLVGIQYQN